MRLLSTRRRSAGEMRDRLVQREVPAAIIHEVMARMDRAELIDDETFAHDWVQQRRELRALSDLALRRELEKRSVDAGIIDAALACTEATRNNAAGTWCAHGSTAPTGSASARSGTAAIAAALPGGWMPCSPARATPATSPSGRSEERRVGKECRSRWRTGDKRESVQVRYRTMQFG